jgi:hypothetical protein
VDDPAESIPVHAEPDVGRDRTIPAETIAPETTRVAREDSSEPPAGAPKLARGLASFSRRNAEREKKFAHLLRDRAPAGPKPRPRGKRG